MFSQSNRYLAILIVVIFVTLSIHIETSDAVILSEGISLNDADGSFIGEDPGDALGTSVAFAGDVNGDGYDDILIATYIDDDAASDAGQVYLVFGNSTAGIDDMDISNANASFLGTTGGDKAGYGITGAGDVNGDGYDDFLISTPRSRGTTYLFFGKSSGWSMDTSLYNANASFIGESTQYDSGEAIDGVGDVNGDGYDDFLIGAPRDVVGGNLAGQTYLILGRSSGWSMNDSLSNANASFIGEEATDHSGNSLAGAGDLNGDGYDDFVIGAPNNDQNGGEAGKIYIIYGMASGWVNDLDLSYANASFVGHAWSYQSKVLSRAGDVNGDGYDDILIGSNTDLNGRAFLVFGGTYLGHNVSLYNANASFVAAGHGDYFSRALSGGADLNGDGYDDIMISSPSRNTNKGTTYIVYGKSSGWSMNLSISNADVEIDGEVNYDEAGVSIAMGGDVNGDGRPDILISSIRNDEGGTDAGQVYLVLNEPNYPPSIITTDDTSANEDELYSVHYQATDIESAPGKLTWDWETDADWMTFNKTSRYLNGTPTNDDVGSYWVNLTVIDEHNGMDWTNFTLTVNNVNDPPEILTTEVSSTDEDELYSVLYLGNDIDPTDDVFTWKLHSNADWLSLDNASGYLNGTPDNYDVGSFWVNVTLSDNQGGYDWSNFTLTVNNVNDAPELIGYDIRYVDEDSDYNVRYDVVDIDPTNDDITYDVTTDADWLGSYVYVDHIELRGTPVNEYVGIYFVNVTIDDGNGGYDWTEYALTVNNTNDDPVIETDDVLTTMEDDLYSVHYSAFDMDPTMDVLTWKLDTDATWLEFDPFTLYLNGTPDNGDVGVYWVNMTVEDDNGGMDWTNFTLEVENVNDAPEIQTEGTITANEDEWYSLKFEGIDVDPTLDILTWSVETDANWLSIDQSTGYLNGTPLNDDVGMYWVNVTVSDGLDGFDWVNFTLEVLNVNDDPVIQPIELEIATEDIGYTLIFEAVDIDPTMDVFTWSLDSDADWLSIDSITGELNGTPGNDDVGSFWANISVSDGNGGSNWVNLTITVTNVNDAPSILTSEVITTDEDEIYLVPYEGVDIDPTSDNLVWGLTTTAVWLSIDPISGNLTGSPGNDDVGTFDVNISLSDGNGGIVWNNFTLEVINVNDPPSILTMDITTATEDELYEVIYGAVDPDPTDDALTWSLDTDASWLEFESSTNKLSGIPTNDDVGTYYVNMTVFDGNGGTTWTYFMITVNNVNDKPTWNKQMEDSVIVDDTITSIGVGVTDPDPDSIVTYSITTDPSSGVVIDENTGEITWEEGISGSYLVNISASDGNDTIYQEFTIKFPTDDEASSDDNTESEFPWFWIILIIVLVVVVILALVIVLRKKREEPEEAQVPEE